MNTLYEDAELKTKLAEAMAAQKQADVKAVEAAPVAEVTEEPKQAL